MKTAGNTEEESDDPGPADERDVWMEYAQPKYRSTNKKIIYKNLRQ